jgi:hypothetical protein
VRVELRGDALRLGRALTDELRADLDELVVRDLREALDDLIALLLGRQPDEDRVRRGDLRDGQRVGEGAVFGRRVREVRAVG